MPTRSGGRENRGDSVDAIQFAIIAAIAVGGVAVIGTIGYQVLRRAVRDGLLEASGIGDA